MKRWLIVVVLIVLAAACSRFKPTPVNLVPVISKFEASPSIAKVPFETEFVIDVTDAVRCTIEPSVRDVPCSGRKKWPITGIGIQTYVLTATHANGKTASGALVVQGTQ